MLLSDVKKYWHNFGKIVRIDCSSCRKLILTPGITNYKQSKNVNNGSNPGKSLRIKTSRVIIHALDVDYFFATNFSMFLCRVGVLSITNSSSAWDEFFSLKFEGRRLASRCRWILCVLTKNVKQRQRQWKMTSRVEVSAFEVLNFVQANHNWKRAK